MLATVDAEASKFDREKWRAQLGPVLELWQSMTSSNPGIINRRLKRADTSGPGNQGPGGGNAMANKKMLDPLDDFVNMEFDLAGDICAEVDSSLNALKKVLFGSGLLTPAIQAVATSLLSGAVPSDWSKLWDAGPEKPQGWLRELVRKRVSLTKWKASLSKNALLSNPLALGDLFNPRTFVNALRQQTARQLGTAIDLVKMICSWEKDSRRMKADCPLPCVLSNLLLQGANFHSNALHESAPEASEMTPTPEVCIGFVPLKAGDVYDPNLSVTIPVYMSPSREEFLMELQIPIVNAEDYDKWILSGVALFLNEED